MVAVIRGTLKCCSFNSIWGSEEICPGQLWFSEELVLWAKNGLGWHWTARSKDQCSSSDSMGHQVSCGFRKEILLKDEKSKCCEMKNFSRTNQTDKKALSIMASQPIWKENSKSSAIGYVSPKVKSQKETPPRWAECSVTDWPLQTLLTDSCQHPVDRIPASSVLATAVRHGVKQFLGLIQGVISFVSLTALDESSSSHKSSPRAQIYAFRVWPSKSWVQLKNILEERLKDFLHFAWWIPRVIRQPQAAWCMWMCCLPLTCRVTSWNKLKKTCSGWLLPKNQGAFAMGIQNKWKLCLKTHSCSSFAIFSITPSVRTLSCWDNWKGFHIAASSRITDVGVLTKENTPAPAI